MAAVKKLGVAGIATASTVYAVVRREVDGYYLNDASGAFAAAPVDKFLALTENAVLYELYETTESRTVWDNGVYSAIFYKQTGGSPDPTVDTLSAASQMSIWSDAEVSLTTVNGGVTFVTASIVGTRKLFTAISSQMDDVIKQIRILLAQILDLEKKVRREPK